MHKIDAVEVGDDGYVPDLDTDQPHAEISPYGTTFYLCAQVSKNMPEVFLLIDSGAVVSLLPLAVYNRIPEDERGKLVKTGRSVCCGNEQSISVHGIAFMVISIDQTEYQVAFHLTSDVPKGLLGQDFLDRYEGDIQTRRKRLHLNGKEIKLYDEMGIPLQHQVVAERTVRVPPGTRYVIPGRITGRGELDDEPFVVEGTPALFNTSGIMVAKMITTHSCYRLGVEVHNTTDTDQKINRNTTIGTISQVKQIRPWTGYMPTASHDAEKGYEDMPNLVDVDQAKPDPRPDWTPDVPRMYTSRYSDEVTSLPRPTSKYYYDRKGTLHAYPRTDPEGEAEPIGAPAPCPDSRDDMDAYMARQMAPLNIALECRHRCRRPRYQPLPDLVDVYADSDTESDGGDDGRRYANAYPQSEGVSEIAVNSQADVDIDAEADAHAYGQADAQADYETETHDVNEAREEGDTQATGEDILYEVIYNFARGRHELAPKLDANENYPSEPPEGYLESFAVMNAQMRASADNTYENASHLFWYPRPPRIPRFHPDPLDYDALPLDPDDILVDEDSGEPILDADGNVQRRPERRFPKATPWPTVVHQWDLMQDEERPLEINMLFTKSGETDENRWEEREGDVWNCQNACYPYGDIPEHSVDDLPEHVRGVYETYVVALELPWDRFAFFLLLKEYSDVFATSGMDLGRTNLAYHHIDTGNNPPVKQKPRRLPQAQHEEMERQVRQLADAGIIRPSSSAYASNVLLVQKKDGAWRLCIDYRALNATTVNKDPYLIPRIDDTLEALQGAKYFCTLDLAQGYHQVELDESSKPKTAFTTPHMTPSLWEFNCMPFGITGGPGTFQRAMDRLLVGMQYKIALAYLDDVIVYGQCPQQVMDRLARVLDRIRYAGLKLKPKKCTFFEEETLYLGHVVSRTGIKCDPAKIEKVRDWPRPTSGKECLQFAGFVNYYNRFIPNFSELAQPLYALGPKKVKFVWGDAQEKSFVALRDALISAPIMAYPLSHGDWILDTDASNYAIGAVLAQMQKDENGEEVERVISYGSKALQGRQQRYCTRRRELLAVVHFVGQFRPYLYGRFVTIRTDHASLRYLKTLNNPDDQFARWMQVLEETYYTIQVRKGEAHGNADAMSRIPPRNCSGKRCICENVRQFESEAGVHDDYRIQSAAFDEKTDAEKPAAFGDSDSDDDVHDHPQPPAQRRAAEEAEDEPQARLFINAFAFTKQWRASDIAAAQRTDPDLQLLYKAKQHGVDKPSQEDINTQSSEARTYFHDWKRIKLESNQVLYRLWESADGTEVRQQIVLPDPYRETMFRNLHDAVNAAHMGRRRTLNKLQKKYYWARMAEDVKNWIRACPTCQRRKALYKGARAPLSSKPAGLPNERVALDVIDHLPRTQAGNVCVLTLVDHFTKYAKAVAMPNQKATTVAEALMKWWVSVFGTPLRIHTDQGRNFESGLIRELCRVLKIHKSRTTPYYPAGNGQCERHNSTIMNMIHTYAREDPTNWDAQLHVVMLGYNSTRHDVTGVEPNLLMLGRNIDMPADLMLDHDPTVMPKTVNEYVRDTERSLRMSYQLARLNIGKAATATKRQYDAKACMYQYKTGDMVKVVVCRRAAGEKFVDRYEGPYYVIDEIGQVTFRVAKTRNSRERVLHHNKLLPYRGTPEERARDNSWVFERARALWGKRGNHQETQTDLHISVSADGQEAVKLLSAELMGDEEGQEVVIDKPATERAVRSTLDVSDVALPEEQIAVYATRRLKGSYDPELKRQNKWGMVTVWISPDMTDEECRLYWQHMNLSPFWNRNIGVRAVLMDWQDEETQWGAHSNDSEPLRALATEMLFYGIQRVIMGKQQFVVVPPVGLTVADQVELQLGGTLPPTHAISDVLRPMKHTEKYIRPLERDAVSQAAQTNVYIPPDMPEDTLAPEWRKLSLDIRDMEELLIGPENTDYGTCWECQGTACGPDGTNGKPTGWCRERSRKFLEPPPFTEDYISYREDPDEYISAEVYEEPTEHVGVQTDVAMLEGEETSELIHHIDDQFQGRGGPPAMRVTPNKNCNGALTRGRAHDGRAPGTRGSTRNVGYSITEQGGCITSPDSEWAEEHYEPSFLDDIKLCDVDQYTLDGDVDWFNKGAHPATVKDYDAPEVKYSLRSREVVRRDKVLHPTPREVAERKPTKRSRNKTNREAVLTDNAAQTDLRVDLIRFGCHDVDHNPDNKYIIC